LTAFYVLVMRLTFKPLARWAEKTPLAYQQTLNEDRTATQEILWALTENAKEAHIVRSNHTDRLYNTLLKVPGLMISLPELQYAKFMDFDNLWVLLSTNHFLNLKKDGCSDMGMKETLIPMPA
jgi:hypothetical protein